MKDVLIRAARTYVQTFLGLLLASSVFQNFSVNSLSVVASFAVAAVPAAISVIQNWLETLNAPVVKAIPRG